MNDIEKRLKELEDRVRELENRPAPFGPHTPIGTKPVRPYTPIPSNPYPPIRPWDSGIRCGCGAMVYSHQVHNCKYSTKVTW